MRAGGVSAVASYVFWIHHEEINGTWDWTGQRNLRGFLQTAQQAGMKVFLRVGPWAHGECRNGGHPDWLVNIPGIQLRSLQPLYIGYVTELYKQIAQQIEGLLWHQGGPIFGAQVDNEYSGNADYLLGLKSILLGLGIDMPLWTKTGWPEATFPYGTLLPFFGGYADNFWSRKLTPQPNGEEFLFAELGTNYGPYPWGCVEIGGGMETSYHRRLAMFTDDMGAEALVKIGSGNNLQGYYMYHGGTNPTGVLTTMEETQETGDNDMPVNSYDFDAPLGEFGQVHEHYHLMRRLHLFVNDFGTWLAGMPATWPDVRPSGPDDVGTLRWSARSDGQSGVIFVNNYQRMQTMPDMSDVQFKLELLDGETLLVPSNASSPLTIPGGAYFAWPFNLAVGDGVKLVYTTANIVSLLDLPSVDADYLVFSEVSGIAAEFAFDASTASLVSCPQASCTSEDGRIVARHTTTSRSAALVLKSLTTGRELNVILLNQYTGSRLWKDVVAGSQRLMISDSDLIANGSSVLRARSNWSDATVSILPPPSAVTVNGVTVPPTADGVFARYSVPVASAGYTVSWTLVQEAGPARKVPIGPDGVAQAPDEDGGQVDFAAAAVWQLAFSPNRSAPAGVDLFLRVNYTGDVARIYLRDAASGNETFLTDNFYNGNPFDVGVTRYTPSIFEQELLLKILPLSSDAPIYVAWPDFGNETSVVALNDVQVYQVQDVAFTIAN